MSHITRTGNLAATPELRQGERGAYTYARVIVTDRLRQEDGSYADGPAIAYEVAVSGDQATNLVAAAQESGNIRVMFSTIRGPTPDWSSPPRASSGPRTKTWGPGPRRSRPGSSSRSSRWNSSAASRPPHASTFRR